MSDDKIEELLATLKTVAMVMGARYVHDLGDKVESNERVGRLAALGYTTEQIASILDMRSAAVMKARQRHKGGK
jgi:hypothetical protein